jgi:glycosyltransferase involved in cell wall biosynthesis
MRIAIVNHGVFPYMLGGMERHTHFLAEHLAELGVDAKVLVPNVDLGEKRDHHNFSRKYHLIEFPWPKARPWLRANFLYSRSAAEYLRQEKFDAVYCQGFNGWSYLADVPRESRSLTLFNPHGLEMFKTVGVEQTIKSFPMRWAAREQARLADCTVSLGGRLTDEALKFLRVPAERVAVLPNAVDLEYINNFRGAEYVRGTARFIFVGRLEANKGVSFLCEAFEQLGNEAHLTIVGSGSLEGELRTRFAGPRIRFAGKLSDSELFALYRESDCFVFASLYEGMPTVILEAMACGLPIIATDIGAVSTMVDKDCGFVVSPGSTEQLIQAVHAYHGLSLEERAQMSDVAYRRVREKFSWSAVAGETLQLIEERLAERSRRA